MNEIINEMLEHLGGNKFLVMTGCSHVVFSNSENSVRMQIPKNTGKVNRVEIVYIPVADLYRMRFYKYAAGRYNAKTGLFTEDKVTNEKVFDDVYADQLSKVFENVTGLYTRL